MDSAGITHDRMVGAAERWSAWFSTHGDTRAVLETLRTDSASVREFVDSVVVPMLWNIGERWHRGELGVDEANAEWRLIADAFDHVTDNDGPAGSAPPSRLILLGCAPGEWHDLPARIVAADLRRRGWSVEFLGPSVTGATLWTRVVETQPFALALSCTLPGPLVSAADLIAIAHDAGVPVAAGGAAFGPSPRRARTLGADAWCRDGAELDQQLRRWLRTPARPANVPLRRNGLSVDEAARIADSALRVLARTDGTSAGRPGPLPDAASTAVTDLLCVAEAAVMTADGSVMLDSLEWWRTSALAQGTPTPFLEQLLSAVADATAPGPLRSMLVRCAGDGRNRQGVS
jgi:methanogenic corrinoid protein MtbC1